jgi:alpha-glucosidase
MNEVHLDRRRRSRFTVRVVKRLVLLLVLLGSALPATGQPTAVRTTSPDRSLTATVTVGADGALTWSAARNGEPLLKPSPLGLVLRNGDPLDDDFGVVGTKRLSAQESYRLVAGDRDRVHTAYAETTIRLRETTAPHRRLRLVVRAYDDGVAFRYVLPSQAGLERVIITGERTAFRWADPDTAWALPRSSFSTSYEGRYQPQPVSSIGSSDLIALPLVVTTRTGPVTAVAEADLTDYAGLYLGGESATTGLRARLSRAPGRETAAVNVSLPATTPWRVLMVAPTPKDLITSTLITDLNDPPATDPDWVEPGLVAWHWWSGSVVDGRAQPMGMDLLRHYVDFAAEYGLRYALVDLGWYDPVVGRDADVTKSIPSVDIPGLVEYAERRGVEIVLWVHWKPLRRQLESALDQYEEWGVRGVKVDFMDRDDPAMVDFYHRLLRATEARRLVVNLHGAYKPTGLRRTYPHLLTREAVRGLEYNRKDGPVRAEHNVTLPFTRMTVGPMDYTPGAFTPVPPAQFDERTTNPVTTNTRAHQLAMYVVYESAMQMVSDHPGAYREAVGGEFLKHVPARWDETRVLAGAIGDYVAVARRHADTWHLGAMTDQQARTLQLSLDFLAPGTDYQALIYQDPDPSVDRPSVQVQSRRVTTSDVLRADLAPRGGLAVRFVPLHNEGKWTNGTADLRVFPTPAQSRVTLHYRVPVPTTIRIDIYDALGRRIRTLMDGTHVGASRSTVDVSTLAAGVYVVWLTGDKVTETAKLVVVP